MEVIAKFRLDSITEHYWNRDTKTLKFSAVCDDGIEENKRFAKYTPSGSFEMACNNPAALVQFELGKFYYLTFREAPAK